MQTVLVVDDEGAIVELLKVCLENYFNVVGANSGEEAIRLLGTLKPDVILLDLAMSNVSGFDVLDWIRGEGITTQVVIVSAHNSIENQQLAKVKGAVEWLTKPFSTSEVLDIVTKLSQAIVKKAEE